MIKIYLTSVTLLHTCQYAPGQVQCKKLMYSKYLVKHTMALSNQPSAIPFQPHFLYMQVSRLGPQRAPAIYQIGHAHSTLLPLHLLFSPAGM